jgi:hypothetical protein
MSLGRRLYFSATLPPSVAESAMVGGLVGGGGARARISLSSAGGGGVWRREK